MKITVESTDRIILIDDGGAALPARIWQGKTASGIPVLCFITRIMPEFTKDDPRFSEAVAEFDRELQEMAAPRPAAADMPGSMTL